LKGKVHGRGGTNVKRLPFVKRKKTKVTKKDGLRQCMEGKGKEFSGGRKRRRGTLPSKNSFGVQDNSRKEKAKF